MKNIVLIRHGQSLGQTARENGIDRNDERLTDCFLSKKGIRQASELRSDATLSRYNFDLVCTSPLTRAVATCVLALGHITEREIEQSAGSVPTTPFIAHSHISETGTGIPENIGRDIFVVKNDLKRKLSMITPPALACLDHIDFSLIPDSWAHVGDCWRVEKSSKKRKLEIFLKWLLEREEKTIAIVCHYNIIRWLLGNSIDRVPNCVPIECVLMDDSRLVLKSDYESGDCREERFQHGTTKKQQERKKKSRNKEK